VFDLDGLQPVGTIPITADRLATQSRMKAQQVVLEYNGVYVAYPTALLVWSVSPAHFPFRPV
jgi:hypothetical protein